MLYAQLRQAIEQEQLVALATIIQGVDIGHKLLLWPDGRTVGTLGSAELEQQVMHHATDLFARLIPGRESFTTEHETVEVFFEMFPPPPKLIIVGAVHIAIPLVTFAKLLGYRTIVIDARAIFATPERFGHADELIVQWPDDALNRLNIDEATCIVTLTHDEKLDNPALSIAVRSNARYIGALGARSTHAKRVAFLRDIGHTEAEIARIHAPIGLNIGARGPEEIAVSIIAEMVGNRHGFA